MYKIKQSISRQKKGLQLLAWLLEQEFAHLKSRSQENLVNMELSIQELIRQLAYEKKHTRKLLQDGSPDVNSLKECSDFFSKYQDDGEMQSNLQELSSWERKCREQARMNADLSLALLDQSKDLLDFLQGELIQDSLKIYSQKGSWSVPFVQEPYVIKGRL
ncbi:MAG: flagellar export chaperone FlgN [Desulfohalobiaceae bacterium]